jgi:hypothetical protein
LIQDVGPSETGSVAHDLERRAHRREPLDHASVIFFEPGARSVDCTIRNCSTTGARVLLAGPVELPDLIQIHVGPGSYFNALVRWRIGAEIGLEFVG